LAEVVFSSWGGKVIDNRQGGEPEALPLSCRATILMKAM